MHKMRTFSIFGAAAIVLTTSKLSKDCLASASSSKSSSPPSAFRSAVSDAFPWARFYDTIQDRREEEGGGGGEDDALLSQSLGPGNPSWTTAEALIEEAEAVPVFVPRAALARMDRSRLRLSSQLYAWKEEEEESGGGGISITEHYAVKRSPAERPVARWRPGEEGGGLQFDEGEGLLHMYERRRDLEGAHLEAMTGTYMPLAGYDNESAHGEITNGKGVTYCTVQ